MNKLSWEKRACALALLYATTAIPLPAQTYTVLHSFDSTDGREPEASLIQASDGNLYGTTVGGGADNWDTVFKITPSGSLLTLYSFCAQGYPCLDGYGPNGIIQATDGNFYGTTGGGGANRDGTVFKITPNGKLTRLYGFCSQGGCADGANPLAALVEGADGNLYGTTVGGGADNWGTVFKITPAGTLTTLHSFVSYTDGANPYAPLLQASDGNFYGTTSSGGEHDSGGTVFEITPSGTLTTVYNFCSLSGCTDGAGPFAGLVQDINGNFYGTTLYGGPNYICYGGCGTVFKMSPSGTLTTLHSFDATDGSGPNGLIQATDGSFYGTTYQGGASSACSGGCGTVFRISRSGALTTLHSFDGTDGEFSYAGLAQDTNGKFYGTTSAGGASGACMGGCGTVFQLSVGLGPFVETQPSFGKVGKAIKILGTDLTGATSVTFNGTPAVFKVLSSSLIGATIPAGATTGTVQVVTPSGTLSSNVPFRVRP
jgi:uncharacterized repeat protein (TIGR03803 family)